MGHWVVYLMDPNDPEDDIFLGGDFEYENDAERFVEEHVEAYGNHADEYSVEWEDFIV